jgi:large subunit ribosomal protein L1
MLDGEILFIALITLYGFIGILIDALLIDAVLYDSHKKTSNCRSRLLREPRSRKTPNERTSSRSLSCGSPCRLSICGDSALATSNHVPRPPLDEWAIFLYIFDIKSLTWEFRKYRSDRTTMARSKRYTELKKLVDAKKLYTPAEAMELVKKTATTKFESTIEVHANLGIDIKKSDQLVRVTIVLPHAAGKMKRVCAFVPSDKEKDATDAGAEIVGGEDLIEKIAQTGKCDFDVAVATPDMMPKIAKLAKILGPKGLMPNPKTETVSTNVKNDSTGNIHQAIGKSSNDAKNLLENFETLMAAIRKAKPAGAKGVFIKSITLTSTMGPAVHVEATV